MLTSIILLFGVSGQPQTGVTPLEGEASDLDLVRAARQDPARFAALYERYFKRIYNFCYLRLRVQEAAEDATSEIFLRAINGLAGYREGLFAAWLFQIARNVVVSQQQMRLATTLYEAEEMAASGPTLEETVVAQAERQSVRAALALLPEEQRTVIELQCVGWTGEQIGEAMGKSGPAVRMLRHRAVERLKQLVLGQEGN